MDWLLVVVAGHRGRTRGDFRLCPWSRWRG